MTEEHPLRTRSEYRYGDDKCQVETLLHAFTAAHRKIAVSWTCPRIIYGPGVTSFMIPFFTVPPMLTLPGGSNPVLQSVHLEDVANATISIFRINARGALNVAPPDWVTMRDLAKMSGRLAVPVPFAMCRALPQAGELA